jgi:hypothetical protein
LQLAHIARLERLDERLLLLRRDLHVPAEAMRASASPKISLRRTWTTAHSQARGSCPSAALLSDDGGLRDLAGA